MTLDPRLPDFWRKEEAIHWDIIAPLVMQALLAGANGAASLMPPEISPLVNWDLFNRAALDFLHRYRLNTVMDITTTTRNQIIRAIDEWVQSGEHLDILRQRLRTFALSKTRADAIAITEVTRIFAHGNMQLWKSTGVVGGKKWMTAVDELVCPICRPLHGKVVELDSNFGLSVDDVAGSSAMRRLVGDDAARATQRAQTLLKHIGAEYLSPPAHVRCRCWLQPFVSEELLSEQIGAILAGQFFARMRQEEHV